MTLFTSDALLHATIGIREITENGLELEICLVECLAVDWRVIVGHKKLC